MTKARKVKKKVGRPAGRRPVLALRVDQGLYDRLSAAAAAHPTPATLAQEATDRLEASFRLRDITTEIFGSDDLRAINIAMFAAFDAGGNLNASDGSWIRNDPDSYREAMVRVIETLVSMAPDGVRLEDVDLLLQSVKGRIATRMINRWGTPQ